MLPIKANFAKRYSISANFSPIRRLLLCADKVRYEIFGRERDAEISTEVVMFTLYYKLSFPYSGPSRNY